MARASPNTPKPRIVTNKLAPAKTASAKASTNVGRSLRTGLNCKTPPSKGKVDTGAVRPSKLSAMLMLLERPDGVTLAELVHATGWQAHSVRGALAGALKRKGHNIHSRKHDGVRRYRSGSAW